MIKLRLVLTKQLKALKALTLNKCHQQQCRHISALYITGDKASENYVTLQPYVDAEATLKDQQQLANNILYRGMQTNLDVIMDKYAKYKSFNEKLKQLEKQREQVAQNLKDLINRGGTQIEQDTLKEHGKTLRNELKATKEQFYPIEDDFMHAYLNLPNELHRDCPRDKKEKIIYRSSVAAAEKGDSHLKHEKLIRFIDNSRYYMMGEAAEFDIHCTQALLRYFVYTGKFIASANPDFVRCVLLEANATPLEHYHLVREERLLNKINPAYLTGGGSFESYLGAMTKLCVYPSTLPLRYVCSGRSYRKATADAHVYTSDQANLFTATQTNAVQTFVAAISAAEADAQMEQILNLAINFYKELNVHFRIVYADASDLTTAECLRAVIEMYSPAEARYIPVGHISNYTDYVSKRILFTMLQHKSHHFLHLVGGPVIYTTRLIAILLECGIPLSSCKLLGSQTAATETDTAAINEFKNIFK